MEHKKLEMFVGEWTFEGESKAVPVLGMTDAGKVSYRSVTQWRLSPNRSSAARAR
jgi:hypothetical protein